MTPKQREILLDPTTPATALLALAVALLDSDVLYWDPMTIRLELSEMLGAGLPQANLNKLMAAIELVTTDGFYRDLPTFIRLCNVLYNGTLIVDQFDPADAGEIAWGIVEALFIWPPDPDDDEPFARPIVEYIGHALVDEGIISPPDVLQLGVLPKGLAERVRVSFSDDPVMSRAIHDVEKAKTEEINNTVMSRLRRLLKTLAEAQLGSDAVQAAQTMLAALQQTRRQSDELKPLL
jgi:hypothetical protein